MIQTRLQSKKKSKYSLGPYNKIKGDKQRIRLTEGCPHNCPWCYEPTEFKVFKIPEIKRNIVEISDMNLLAKEEAYTIIFMLPTKLNGKLISYEMICGFDYRFMTCELTHLIKYKRFRKIRIAWDWGLKEQVKIKDCINKLIKAGYKPKDIMVFMICNWKIPYEECCLKLDLLKVWNVKVADCYFDNQTFPRVIPVNWSDQENKSFRKKCRNHNQMVLFKIYPEIK